MLLEGNHARKEQGKAEGGTGRAGGGQRKVAVQREGEDSRFLFLLK